MINRHLQNSAIEKAGGFSANLFDNYTLETFHHLLYDSLMPWLPGNSDPFCYQAILPDLLSSDQNYFKLLRRCFNKKVVVVPDILDAEWAIFSKVKTELRAAKLFGCRLHLKAGSKKVVFYENLIFQTLLYGQSFLATLMKQASEPMKQFYISKWIKTIGDLRQHTHELYGDPYTPDRVIIFIADLALSILETEIQHLYSKYCQTVYMVSSLCCLCPTDSSRDENYLHEKALDRWYGEVYLQKILKQGDHAPESKAYQTVLRPDEQEIQLLESLYRLHAPVKKTAPKIPVEDTTQTKKKEEPQIIGTREVRQLLGIGKTKLHTLCKQQTIPHFKIGRLIKFDKQEIILFREGHKIAPGKGATTRGEK